MIMTILNDSFLEDLGSTNGTLVNGQPIKKHFLQNNDVIELGKYRLKYMAEGAPQQASPDFEKTMVLRAPAASVQPPAGAPAAAPAAAKDATVSQPMAKNFGDTVVNPEMMQSHSPGSLRDAARQAVSQGAAAPLSSGPEPKSAATEPKAQGVEPKAAPAPNTPAAAGAPGGAQGTIQILSGPSAGKELPLSKPLTTLGKPGVQVAVIAKRPQGYFITHVEGASFPVVNGRQLDAQAHALTDHSVIELAGVKMEFFLKPPA